MVQIEILSGPELGQVFDLDEGTHTLGRAASNRRALTVDSVSGRHLELTVDAAGVVRFKDLGSTNGTWSGGEQVQEGQWFPGTELRLGSCALRLVDADSALAEQVEEEEVHRRAREAAMSSKRQGGPMQMMLGLLLVLGAGGGAWWALGSSPDSEDTEGSRPTAAGDSVSVQDLDEIDGLGDFTEVELWGVGGNARVENGRLHQAGGSQLVRLHRTFPLREGALRLKADVSGLKAMPVLYWGEDADTDLVHGSWWAADLAAGEVRIDLPPSAEWFSLGFRLEGSGSLGDLEVHAVAGQARALDSPIGKFYSHGANLYLADSDGPMLCLRGSSGEWDASATGLGFRAGQPGKLQLQASGGLLTAGPALILAEGGPVGMTPGVRVDASPGLLLGGGAVRLMMDLPQGGDLQVGNSGAIFQAVEGIALSWDLSAAMTEAARLSQRVQRASREGDDRQLLSSAAELLLRLPLDDLKVQEALLLSREAMERGRAELAVLQVRASGAVFVGAESTMRELAADASALAAAYPGTDIELQATGLTLDLEAGAEQAAQSRRERLAAYRGRLQGALEGAYPVIGAWLKEVQ